jgi:hypothetical protein
MIMKKDSGQVILVLILVMTVALAIGLSVVQRSLSDITTATKQEQSQRAFSAAEAGIERALGGGSNSVGSDETGNQSSSALVKTGNYPLPNQALEFPSVNKEEMAQFWLADPKTLTPYYIGNSFDVYFGLTSTGDDPAIEVSTVTKETDGSYKIRKDYFDSNSNRTTQNNFSSLAFCNSSSINTSSSSDTTSPDRSFRCKATISGFDTANSTLILTRVRVLYSNASQPLAVKPAASSSLPPQVQILTSKGTSGETERQVQLFKQDSTVPFLFDYAIFSTAEIKK